MCDSNLKLKFCSCKTENETSEIIHNKNSRHWKYKLDKGEYLKKEFLWTIAKYSGRAEIAMDGMIVGPSDKLSNEVNAEFLLDELNNNLDLFDFDYLPAIGDNIIVRSKYVYPKMKNKPRPELFGEHMSFIFRDKGWENDFYHPFYEITEDFLTGKMKIIHKAK